jgi:diguanylate cyclase (GGDEF)-like protein
MLSRLALQGGNVSVLVLDLDHFKHINDRHGHPTGDRVLRAFADAISRDALRQRDLFGRLGGEEFAIVLHSAGRGAMNVAERIRDAIAALEIPTDDGRDIIRATTSIGLAAGKAARGDLALLIARADQALYRAKQNGRNRVERWLDELPDDTSPREYPHSDTCKPEK